MQNKTQGIDALENSDARDSRFNNKKLTNSNQTRDTLEIKCRNLLDKFVSSVQVLVDDITALEVNTMVVSNITGSKFSAWEAYQEIYSIHDKDYFKVKGIPDDSPLRERYQRLFAQLEREYFYIIIEDEKLHNDKVEQYHKRLALLKEIKQGNIVESDPRYVELARPILPSPSPVIDSGNTDNRNENWQQEWQQNCQEIHTLLMINLCVLCGRFLN